jgi:hypothetical protein
MDRSERTGCTVLQAPWRISSCRRRTSNPACSSEQVVSNLALQYAVILVIGVERDFGSCAGPQSPISKIIEFVVGLI